MEHVELLTIKDTYWLNQNEVRMLILHPNFSVPKGGWKTRIEKVAIVRPDGQKLAATAKMAMTHLNISDPKASIDERWRVTMWLTDRTVEEVPIGSKVLVSPEVSDALALGNAG